MHESTREATDCRGAPTTLYRIIGDVGNGRWLAYVGISTRWQRRLLQHERNQPTWWEHMVAVELEQLCCQHHAQRREIEVIRAERPWFNIAHNPHYVGT